MKDFELLKEQCLKEIIDAGITPGKIVEWKINRRARRRWGQCTRRPNGESVIEISSRLLEDDKVSEKACKETIIHEILHSCPECSGHTGRWKQYAAIMNIKYGYNIKRTSSDEEKGLESEPVREMAVKYTFVCQKCGYTFTRKRKSKFTRRYKLYGCGVCGAPYSFKRYTM